MRTILAAALLLSSCAAVQRQGEENRETATRAVERQVAKTVAPELAEQMTEIRGLVAKLASVNYRERQAAVDKLGKTGLAAVPAIEKAAKSPDPQIAHLARDILEKIELPSAPLTISNNPRSSEQQKLTGKLKKRLPQRIKEIANLDKLIAFMRDTLDMNVFIHPEMQITNEKIPKPESGETAEKYLSRAARELDAVWVARYGVIALASPETGAELAQAEVLSTRHAKEYKLMGDFGLQDIKLFISRKTSIAELMDFFSEIEYFQAVFAGDVNPTIDVPRITIQNGRMRDLLALVLFSKGLTAAIEGGDLLINKGDFSKYSREIDEKRKLLQAYRNAWAKYSIYSKQTSP